MPLHSGARVRHEPGLGLTLIEGQRQGAGFDYGAVIRWPAGQWEERLEQFERFPRGRNGWPSLLVAHGLAEPADLEERLVGRGWTRVVAETALWTRLPAVVPHLDPMMRVEAVTDRSAEEHERVEREIFGLPASATDARIAGVRSGIADGTLRAYLVRSQGTVVAVARLSLAELVAGIYGVGVVPGRRREGFGTLVTTIATRAGLASGRRLVWLSVDDTNPGARALYEGIGFQPAFSWSRWLAAGD